MTPTDCVDVVEFLAARCPAMRMHEKTPDAWYVDLAAHTRDDAIEAVRRTSRRQTFVGLNDLIAECETIAAHRAGQQRVAELEQQIAAENPPAELHNRPAGALTTGQPMPDARAELRRERLRIADRQKRQAQADAAARAAHAARKAEAAAELEPVRRAAATSTGATATRSTEATS